MEIKAVGMRAVGSDGVEKTSNTRRGSTFWLRRENADSKRGGPLSLPCQCMRPKVPGNVLLQRTSQAWRQMWGVGLPSRRVIIAMTHEPRDRAPAALDHAPPRRWLLKCLSLKVIRGE